MEDFDEGRFAEILREVMAKKGINQLQLSEMLQVRQSQVSNWVNKKSLPGYNSLRMLCVKLDMDPKVFLQL
ncbi:MAG: helix-turn-helix domain-containing protein [Firmicutes bacterium]|nr:helix-turn-helix domain-containing protein [Bacillota bacterium]